jgi:3D (Asp-Asp-Asp) domain-containing protein
MGEEARTDSKQVWLVALCVLMVAVMVGAWVVRVQEYKVLQSRLVEVDQLEAEVQELRAEIEELHEMKEVWDELEMDRFRSTAYAPHDNRSGMCSDGDPTRTALGTYPSRGTFAVNPRVIPYRSDMLVIGDGWFEHGQALDTGGAILATDDLIDRYVDTYEEAREFGCQDVLVIYSPPEE